MLSCDLVERNGGSNYDSLMIILLHLSKIEERVMVTGTGTSSWFPPDSSEASWLRNELIPVPNGARVMKLALRRCDGLAHKVTTSNVTLTSSGVGASSSVQTVQGRPDTRPTAQGKSDSASASTQVG